jgi:hypothetical protein
MRRWVRLVLLLAALNGVAWSIAIYLRPRECVDGVLFCPGAPPSFYWIGGSSFVLLVGLLLTWRRSHHRS